ncbi:MAG: hypothetical protein K1Y36_18615 [Blastocatellia bacterium]|nr:hypothetical protein [Blastocatellia bacterium]
MRGSLRTILLLTAVAWFWPSLLGGMVCLASEPVGKPTVKASTPPEKLPISESTPLPIEVLFPGNENSPTFAGETEGWPLASILKGTLLTGAADAGTDEDHLGENERHARKSGPGSAKNPRSRRVADSGKKGKTLGSPSPQAVHPPTPVPQRQSNPNLQAVSANGPTTTTWMGGMVLPAIFFLPVCGARAHLPKPVTCSILEHLAFCLIPRSPPADNSLSLSLPAAPVASFYPNCGR